MKVKDIVSEHAKGRRAKIYTKKPSGTIEPKKTSTNEMADISAQIKDYKPGQSITYSVGDKEIMQDLKQNPGAISYDAQGNPVINTASMPGQTTGTSTTAPQQKLQPGAKVSLNTQQTVGTGPKETMGTSANQPVAEMMHEINPKLARYYLRKIDAGEEVTDLINDSAELHTMYNDAALMHHLHPDDDFEKIEQIVINNLNDIADSDYDNDFYDTNDSDLEPADEYEFESIKRLAGL